MARSLVAPFDATNFVDEWVRRPIPGDPKWVVRSSSGPGAAPNSSESEAESDSSDGDNSSKLPRLWRC